MTPTEERPLRADAQRNREQLIQVATRLFAERGLDVPLEEIATEAGVGIGTFYRHFPERNALIAALVEQSLGPIARRAEDLIASDLNPWEALRTLLTEGAERHTTDRSMAEMWRTLDNEIVVQVTHEVGLYAATQVMLDAARGNPGVREDVVVEDVARVFYAIAGVVEAGHGDAWRRVLELHLRGMTAPGPALPDVV